MTQPTGKRVEREKGDVLPLPGIAVVGVTFLGDGHVPASIPAEERTNERVV